MSADPIVYCLEHLTDYRQFERLCSDVMAQSGYPDIEPLGGSNDGGRDAIHVSRQNAHEVTLFAYSVRGDWQAKLLADCRRIQEEAHDVHRVVFVCTANVTASQRDEAIKRVGDRFGWELEICGLERLRIRLASNLKHLIASHPAIFCPPFFPRRGGLSIAESRDTLVIDHAPDQYALATWLSRRLQLAGYRVWCYGTAPLAGENADESIRALMDSRAKRYLPVLSEKSLSDADFVSRCGTAAARDGLLLPCFASAGDVSRLPTSARTVTAIRFSESWSTGLRQLLESLSGSGVAVKLDSDQGRSIALRSYVPVPVTKLEPENIYSNTFATSVPDAVLVCKLSRALREVETAELRTRWAFVKADALTLLSFERPPKAVPLQPSRRLAEYSWKHHATNHGKRSTHVVTELVRRSLDIACRDAGLSWCEDRKKFYFVAKSNPQLNLSFVHVDGRPTRAAATGEKNYGKGERAQPFRYQLCPTFFLDQDTEGRWWTTMRLYVRITDTNGVPHQKKAISRRRKSVCKRWWNREWFARTLAVMQALARGADEIVIGNSPRSVSVSTRPLQRTSPVAIDCEVLERIGDFQEELAELRFAEEIEAEQDEAAEECMSDE